MKIPGLLSLTGLAAEPAHVTIGEQPQPPLGDGASGQGLGLSLTYQKFADGVWFPLSYGAEFAVRGLFFYKRKISVSTQNGDFRKTDVSTVAYVTDAH